MGISIGSAGSATASTAQQVKVTKIAEKQEEAVVSKLMESIKSSPTPNNSGSGGRVNVKA